MANKDIPTVHQHITTGFGKFANVARCLGVSAENLAKAGSIKVYPSYVQEEKALKLTQRFHGREHSRNWQGQTGECAP